MPGVRTPALLPHPGSARASASLSNVILWLLRLFHDVYRPVPIHTKQKAERGKLRIVELRPSGQGKVDPMSNILIGTASWTDKSLIASGRFYPRSATPQRKGCATTRRSFRLSRWTAATTRCRSPRLHSFGPNARQQNFTFNIKAFRLFTGHQTSHRCSAERRRRSTRASREEEPLLQRPSSRDHRRDVAAIQGRH